MKSKRSSKFLWLMACILTVLILPACRVKDNYRVGSVISDAYVKQNKLEVAGVDSKAIGYQYDYDKLTYELVWSDEFDYEGQPDQSKWNYDVGGDGWGNNELQYYTNGQNVYVKEDNLVIEARKEDYEGKQYTSARLVTKGKGDWLYGKIEVRAKLPEGVGTWPAIWMLPTDWVYGGWPASGEIDIMEHVGYQQNTIHGTIHTQAYHHTNHTQKTATKYIETASEEYHVYTLEWLPDKIMIYVDNELYFTFEPTRYKSIPTYKEWPFDQKMHLLLNLAVGGNWGGVQGVDDSIFPQQMLIDYIRVYQSKEIIEFTHK